MSNGPFAAVPARAIDDRRMTPGSLRILVLLATYANRQGRCWPSVPTLANRLEISRQAIQGYIRDLQSWGYLRVQAQLGGCNQYKILYDVEIEPEFDRATHETCQPELVPHPPTSAIGGQPQLGPPRQPQLGPNTLTEHLKKESPLKPPKGPKGNRGTRLSADWSPNERNVPDALQAGVPRHAIKSLAAEFRDYWIAIPGQRGTKLDWDATWRNWCRRAAPKFAGFRANGNGGYTQPQRKRRNILDEMSAAESSDLDQSNPEPGVTDDQYRRLS